MADTDLSAQLKKISDTAKALPDRVTAAGQRTQDQLKADVADARAKASAAADQFKDTAENSRDKATSQWQEIRGKWQAHITKVRKDFRHRTAQLDAKDAAKEADIAEVYAKDAINFVQVAIEEAEYAVLDAKYARAHADTLSS